MEQMIKKYPKTFKGRWGKKYKLIKLYDRYGLYEAEAGYKICFDLVRY